MSERNKNRPGYKETKIGWIPEEWEFKSLECICTKVTDGTHDTPQRHSSGIPLLTTRNLNGGSLTLETDYYISKKDFLQINKRSEVSVNDILFGMIGTIGSPVRIEDISKPFAVKNMAILKFEKNSVGSMWVCFYLSSPGFHKYINRQLSGNAQKFVGLGFVRKLKIPIPSIPEQQEIARILSAWDRGIELVGKLIDAKQRLKKGLMQQLLTGRIRFPQFGKPAAKKDELPEGWRLLRLCEIVNINQESLSEKTAKAFEFKYIDLSSVKEGKIELPTDKISFGNAPSRARRRFSKEDILVATVRPNLKGFAYIDFSADDYICSTGFAVLRAKTDFNSRFIYHNFYSHETARYFYGCVVGSNYPALNNSDIDHLKIPCPMLTEQKKIAALLSTCDQEIELLRKKEKALKQQKKGLMQKLLTGEVRVKCLCKEKKHEYTKKP